MEMHIDVQCEDGDAYGNIYDVRTVEVTAYPPRPAAITFDGNDDKEVTRRLKPGLKTRVTLSGDDFGLQVNGVMVHVSSADEVTVDLDV